MGRAQGVSILLDTNALIWTLNDEAALGARARRHVEDALQYSRLLTSAVSFWEVAMLAVKRRIVLNEPAEQWRLTALRFGIEEVPLDGQFAIDSVTLTGLHGDPMDRMIAATAIRLGVPLVTSDARLVAWQGPLACIDARV
jgi:PIN domain nuclease of toxin-antitoxin system